MTMLTVMTMFLIYPFTLSHEHRHHRHHRHAYSEMTLAVYYCSKQKQWYYEKHKIRMTQMTLMTQNLGYGKGISQKQRHPNILPIHHEYHFNTALWKRHDYILVFSCYLRRCVTPFPEKRASPWWPRAWRKGNNNSTLESESERIHFFESRFLNESKVIHSEIYTNLYGCPVWLLTLWERICFASIAFGYPQTHFWGVPQTPGTVLAWR